MLNYKIWVKYDISFVLLLNLLRKVYTAERFLNLLKLIINLRSFFLKILINSIYKILLFKTLFIIKTNNIFNKLYRVIIALKISIKLSSICLPYINSKAISIS